MEPNNAGLYLRVNLTLSIIAAIAVALRLVARYIKKVTYGYDDLFVVIALVFLIGLNINGAILYTHAGADGTAFADLGPDQTEVVSKCFYASQILYYLCMLPTKLSILALYHRIFTPRNFRVAIYVVAAICIAWFIGNILPTILQCRPVAFNWNRNLDGSCINIGMLFSAITISNLLTDVVILCMPFPVISTLKLKLKSRLAVSSIFLLGGATCICSLVRVISQYRFGNDVGALIIDCALWTIVEPALAVLSACLPTLRPLVPTKRISSLYSNYSKPSNSDAGTTKGRGSWFGPASKQDSGARYGRNTVDSTAHDRSTEDTYPLKGFDHAYAYSVSTTEAAKRGSSGNESAYDVTRSHESNHCPLNRIHIKREVMVNEASVLDL